MVSSFNAFGSKSTQLSQLHTPVWLGVVKPVPIGGVLAEAFRKSGLHLKAGSAINLNEGVITPFVAFEVVSFTAGDGTTVTVDTIVIKPCVLGGVTFLPAAEDKIQKLGSSFAATGKAAEVVSVTALTGDDAGKYSVTVSHAATIDTPSAKDFIVLSAATSAGNSESIKVQPNAYLYNDIFTGDADENVNASGAAVRFHAEGLLIDLTPSAEFKEQMAAAVPGVLQVSA